VSRAGDVVVEQRPSPVTVVVLVVVVLVALGAHLALRGTLNINWDEWNYLAKVHTLVRGGPLPRLQTFHAHLFAPLLIEDATLPDREVLEVLRLRLASWGMLATSAMALVWLGWRLLGSLTAGLAAALSALGVSFVLAHGTAARYDPLIVGAFFVAAVGVVEATRARSTLRALLWAVGAALVLAVGVTVSIKAALYAPTVVVLWAAGAWGAVDTAARRRSLVAAIVFALVALLAWRGLLTWHGASLTVPPSLGGSPSPSVGLEAQLASIGDTMLQASDGSGPERRFLSLTLRYDVAFWGLCLAGLVLGLAVVVGRGPAALRARVMRARTLQALSFALPLLALLGYRNTYPYFFVTILPPAALLAGVVVVVIETAWSSSPRGRAAAVLGLMIPGAFTAARFVALNGHDQLGAQRTVLQAVHEVFPTPVPYVDRCGMVASHPRVGPFISTMTMGAYHRSGAPIWPALLDTARPQFLLANVRSLELQRPWDKRSPYRWHPDDHRILQESFIPHWGPLWVAGRTVDVGSDEVAFALHIGGAYRLEASGPVILDDVERAPGAVVELAAGLHRARAAATTTLTLRTASAATVPTVTPPGPLFTSFRPRGMPRLPPARRPGAAVEDDATDGAP
jgi:hypothetical protein